MKTDLGNLDLIILPIADRPATMRKDLSAGGMGRIIMEGIGSSDVEDYEDDIIERSALEQLCAPIEEWRNCYIDHTYLTSHILGNLAYQPELTTGTSAKGLLYAAVKIGVDVFLENALATLTVKALEKVNGPQIGFSVGMIPVGYEPRRDKGGRPTGGVRFFDVERREFSSTPMPANPTAWVTNLVKSLRTQGVLPHPEDAIELRNVAKHWHELDTLDGARLIRLARVVTRKAVSVESAGLLAGRTFDNLTPQERDEMARRVADALQLAA